MRKIRYISPDKSIGDLAVTQTYIKIIKKAFKAKDFIPSSSTNAKGISKEKDFLLFDECKNALKYIISGYKNVTIWIQGVTPEEAVMMGYSKIRYYAHSLIERIVLPQAKIVFFCSTEMKRHYEKKYHLRFANYIIMPCFNELGIDKQSFKNPLKYINNTFLYVGSLSAWQCFDEILSIYRRVEIGLKKMGKTSKLYVYTGDQDKAIRKIKRAGITSYEVGYYPADQLGEHIRDYKYGFVIRQDCEVNRVATPTKLSNYISHGIIPIYSDCLRSFDIYNKKSNGPGIVCNAETAEADSNNILKNIGVGTDPNYVKEWCANTFNSYYSAQRYIDKIVELLTRLGL